MTLETQEKIRVLILTNGNGDMATAADFLNKRNFSVTVKTNLRDGVASLMANRSEWVLLSINMGPVVDKFTSVLKSSFNIDPILFADVLDRRALSQLDRYSGHVMTSKVTGPNIRMKISQIVDDRNQTGVAKHRLPPKATSGVRRDSFGHVMVVKGPGSTQNGGAEMSAPEGAQIISTSVAASPRPTTILAPLPSHPLPTADQLCVVLADQSSQPGYYVIGMPQQMQEASRSRLFGPIVPNADRDPKWEGLCHKMVKQIVPLVGEVPACFVPAVKPLPAFQKSTSDKAKMEVSLEDVPSDIPLPCPLYIFLEQNQKFVCLIKGGGVLTSTQKERLLKLGLKVLLISNDDVQSLSQIYIREMIQSAA